MDEELNVDLPDAFDFLLWLNLTDGAQLADFLSSAWIHLQILLLHLKNCRS